MPEFGAWRLEGGLGARIEGIRLDRPLDPTVFARLHEAFLSHRVLVFREPDLPAARHVALGRLFGEVQIHVMNQYHADGHPELYELSNLDAGGRPSGRHPDRGTLAWHTDGSWRPRTGHATLMYACEVPAAGGETEFCDMYEAHDTVDAGLRGRLEGLRAVHNLDFSRSRRHGEEPMTPEQRAAVPPVDHPILRTHPETGRRAIFLGDHAESVVGMDYAEGRALIEEVNALSVVKGTVYRHTWRPGDLVVWDNRCLLHRARPFDTAGERRVMRRCTVVGDVPR